MNNKLAKGLALPLVLMMLLIGCTGNNASNEGKSSASASGTTKPSTAASETASAAPDGKPATWIADRKIKGLVFMDSDDYTEDMNPEIKRKIKELTGIEFSIEMMKADHSIDGLIAGLAAGDLPDFISFYLNNSGRPEMPVILKAAREEMFYDFTPMIKDTKVYSKYLQDDYLPLDTKYGVMFRPEFNGSTYFIHMNIPREPGYESRKYAGGPYIRKDIAEALGVDPKSIKTMDQLYDLAKKIKAGNFKDNNGKDVYPIGPEFWGGDESERLFNELMWGAKDQRIKQDKDGRILHEAQTPIAMKKVEFMQKLLAEKLIHPEFFTVDESRATEAALNGTSAIISNMHNYQEFNLDGHYIPLGPINLVDGPYRMEVSFKSGYSGWAIPTTTKKPEEIVKFADFLATREGKLLWRYGLEGRDYTLDDKGNPVVKPEVIELKKNDPNAAKALGFQGVGNNWGDLLGATDIDSPVDFGEAEWGDNADSGHSAGALKLAELYGYDELRKNAKVVDAYPPISFLGEFAQGTALKTAFDNYDDSLVRAYYSKNPGEAQKILDSALKQLESAGLNDYLKLLADKNADPKTKVNLRS